MLNVVKFKCWDIIGFGEKTYEKNIILWDSHTLGVFIIHW